MNSRILAAKLLACAAVCVALVSHHVYAEESLANLLLEVFGYTLLAVAALGRIWSSAFISGKKSTSLVTGGPYSMVRHPLYFFSFIGFVGAGLALKSLVLATTFGVIFFMTHWQTILQEELKLTRLFPDAFPDYVARVPRFVPRPWILRVPESAELSPRIFSKAMIDASLIAAVFMGAHVLEWAHNHDIVPVMMWLY